MSIRRALPLLVAVSLAGSGCAGLAGERVETGIAPDEEFVIEVSADPSALALVDDDTAATRTVASSAMRESFEFYVPELFSGVPLDGGEIYESGEVILTFVSPTCNISVENAPAHAVAAELDPGITYVFAHNGADRDAYLEYVEAADLYQENVIHVDDTDLVLWNRFSIEVQPSSILVDGDGVVTSVEGGLDHEGLANAAALVLGLDA